jgi:hypothetical protein
MSQYFITTEREGLRELLKKSFGHNVPNFQHFFVA